MMKKINSNFNFYRLFISGIFLLFSVSLAIAQYECQSTGWANLDGQTYVGPVTGGGNASPIQVTSFSQLKSAAESSGSKVIYVMNSMGNGYSGTSGDVLNVTSNKTIIGYSPGITVKCSWQIRNTNIIVRNLICRGPGNSNSEQNWDVVNIAGPAKRIWFDHCTIMEGEDGNFDVVKGADNVSVTWCKFTYVTESSHNLSNLVGSSDSESQSHGKLNITYAYCWWENVQSRTPRTRYGQIHVLNSYYHDCGGTRAGYMANQRMEGCYFENISSPIDLISSGGKSGIFVLDCHFVGDQGSTKTDGYNTVFTPPYSYFEFSTQVVKARITDENCGAGPTLDSPTSCGGCEPSNTFTLTTSITGQGSVSPSGGVYLEGSNVSAIATPVSGWKFVSWSGDLSGSTNPITITMDRNITFTANFSVITTEPEISIQENKLGFCGVDGSVDNNNSGFTGDGFANTDNAIGKGVDYKVTIESSGTYTIKAMIANGLSDRPANILLNGAAIGTLSMPGTGNWTTWTTTATTVNLSAGTHELRLEATTSGGLANLDYITISGASVSAADCNGQVVTYTLATSANGSGNVSGAGTYEQGTQVSLTATSNSGWQFDGWSGSLTGSSNPASLFMDGNKSVTANFSEIPVIQYSLTTSVNGQGSVNPSSSSYAQGLVVSVIATPASGWKFDNWSGDASGSANPLLVSMSSNKSITANFSLVTNPTTITIQENTTGFCSVDGTIDNNNTGFTGAGFANTDNVTGKGITWSVAIPTAGSYNVVFRYANGGTTDRTAQLMENGSIRVSNISMPSTGSWTSWAETSATNMNLSDGTLLVRLQATTSGGLTNIDYMQITGEGHSEVVCTGLKSASENISPFESKAGLDAKVYPIPVDDLLHIQFSDEPQGQVVISLLDLQGRKILSEVAISQGCILNLSDVPEGSYFLQIVDEQQTILKKIVK